MAQSFYSPGQDRAVKVRHLFSGIARRYDLINDLQSFGLHRLWKQKVAKLGELEKGMLALDLCCGTCDIALNLSRYGNRVVGLDFTSAMLNQASARLEGHRNSGIQLLQADALNIPFRDCHFDLVTVAYGLR